MQLRSSGLVPATVIDIGAAFGGFTRECSQVFPKARYLMVEPLDEWQPSLQALAQELPSAVVAACAAGSAAGQRVFHVHRDLAGSSFFAEAEGQAVDGEPRTVAVDTVDAIVARIGAPGPFLVKVDTQGAELDVLRGAKTTLAQTEVVIAEVSLFRFFEGGPAILEVLEFMRDQNFVVYDLAGLLYRPLDGALAQADMVLVRENGSARVDHRWATPAQRAEQDLRFEAELKRQLPSKGSRQRG